MTLTLDIGPEVQAELARKAAVQGRAIETIAAALLENAIHAPAGHPPNGAPPEVIEACTRLETFGKTHGLSLGAITVRELRDEARP